MTGNNILEVALTSDNGDVVRLNNQRGECLAGAVLTETVREGVLFLWTGAWFDPNFDHGRHCDNHGIPIVLTHDLRTSRLSQGSSEQSALVTLEKFIDELPTGEAFKPPTTKASN